MHTYDDLTSAVTKSSSKKAEMMLMEIFVMALEYIKNVRRIVVLLGWLPPLSACTPGVWRTKHAVGVAPNAPVCCPRSSQRRFSLCC